MNSLSIFIYLSLFCLLSSTSYYHMWVLLELVNFAFVPALMDGSKLGNRVKIFLYYITQGFASGIFFFGMMNTANNSDFFFYCMIIGLLIKLGAVPFHSWLPMVTEMMSWDKLYTLLTWVKIGPMVILLSLEPGSNLILLFVIGSLISIGGVNSSSLRMIMTYSSISHMSWCLIVLCMSKVILIFYLMVYWFMLAYIFKFFSFYELKTISDLSSKISKKTSSILLSLLALSAVPPFIGFFPKMSAILVMCQLENYFEALLMLIISLFPLYFYMKICMFVVIKQSKKLEVESMCKKNTMHLSILGTFFMGISLMLMVFFMIFSPNF